MNKIKILLSTVVVGVLAVPLFVSAVAPGVPPNGLVAPMFNGLNIGTVGPTPLFLTSKNFSIDSAGDISSPVGGEVVINDPQGVKIDATEAQKGLIINNDLGGLIINSDDGGATINSDNGGLTINTADGGLTVVSTGTGGVTVRGGGANINGQILNEVPIPSIISSSACISSGGIVTGSGTKCSFAVYVKDDLTVNKDLEVSGTLNAKNLNVTGSHNISLTNYVPNTCYFFGSPYSCCSSGGYVVTIKGFITADRCIKVS